MNKFIEFSAEVKSALENNKPVIALESTIISHGMPFPRNIEVANNLENIARDKNVIPATICLMNGKIKIGLNENELNILAKSDKVRKVSRREIPEVLARNEIGATTVAATMIAAHLAGIKVFATGGIGGVHRGAETSFDISTDLIELSRTPVIVVTAGAKAILDLPKTLEYLETLGINILGYKTDFLPAFYSSKSNLKIKRVGSTSEIVNIFKISQELGFPQGLIIANPVPEKFEIPFNEIGSIIQRALQKAVEQNVKGQKVTPFLLSKIVEFTNGKSLETNIKLVENNVRLACEIFKELD
ncbi:MAG: pseudouridine-5'-phosphate glycosidase [Candidatus Cloacimonetes bacterium]|nr:pseudouridine-5'-phosphate glycosidase [Candidatus Cloacimonadota bacterium]